MPYLDSFQQVLYDPSWPYHYLYDNIPIQNLLNIQQIINQAVDSNTQILGEAVGTAGSLAARLDVSLNDDGSLKTSAVDLAMHTMDDHTDTDNYVRMTVSERELLEGITPGATSLWINVSPGQPPVTEACFPADQSQAAYLEIQDSESIAWQVIPGTGQPCGSSGFSGESGIAIQPTILRAHMTYPPSLAIQHYYGITPMFLEYNSTGTLFQATSVATNYVEGSLRVYINGIRIFSDVGVYVPSNGGISGYSGLNNDIWYLTNFTPIQNGDGSWTTFQINTVVNPHVDIVRVDFDSLYT